MTSGEAPIELASYDPAWPSRFRIESDELQRVLAPWLAGSVEHIGSTAVPGLAAKPVIDIMAGVSNLDVSRPAIEAGAVLGYCYFSYLPPLEHWVCQPSPAVCPPHLPPVPLGPPPGVSPVPVFR